MLTLHAIIVKKPISYNDAREIAKHFTNKKFYRETNSSYRFRHFPKQQFIPNSFRTKKLSNDVSLVFGKHKDAKHAIIQGGSLWNDIIDKVSNFLLKYNPLSLALKSTINNTKNKK